MFQIKEKLANTRPPQSKEPELVLSPTKGIIKITAPICELIGVSAEDYVGIVKADVGGEDGFYLYKGEHGDGNKLTAANGKIVEGVTLTFSARNSWEKMGGSIERTIVFEVGTTPESDDNGQEYWPLAENGFREKQAKGASKED